MGSEESGTVRLCVFVIFRYKRTETWCGDVEGVGILGWVVKVYRGVPESSRGLSCHQSPSLSVPEVTTDHCTRSQRNRHLTFYILDFSPLFRVKYHNKIPDLLGYIHFLDSGHGP